MLHQSKLNMNSGESFPLYETVYSMVRIRARRNKFLIEDMLIMQQHLRPPIPKAKDWKEVADGVVAEGMKESLHNIDTIVSAVFGNKVSQNEIPKSMRHANVKNPALAVFGGGRWLQDNPTDGLQKQFEQTRKRMVSQPVS